MKSFLQFNKHKNNKTRGPQYREVENSQSTGIFKLHKNYGFIRDTDLYVREENINTALNNDLVEYVVIENLRTWGDQKNKFEARIVRVIKRDKTKFVGEIIYKEPTRSFVLLDNPRLNKVALIDDINCNLKEKVAIELTSFDLNNLTGKLIKKLGKKGDKDIEMVSILEDYGIKNYFSREVEEEMSRTTLGIDKEQPLRVDYTHINFVTIDPDSSQDFDDAVATYREEDGYRLYVAIADVWHYLKDSPNTNREAEKRSCSIYYLDSVIPMLPEKLSNDYCSLNPRQERYALVLNVKISLKGEVMWDTVEVKPGVIFSRRRCNYGEVNRFFDGEELNDASDEVKKSLMDSFELYQLLEKKRINQGYIAINCPEIKFKLDGEGEIVNVYPYERGHSQIMIENFMILANEAIARLLTGKSIPTIYRVHEKPKATKLIAFLKDASQLNFKVDEGENLENISQLTIFKWFKHNENNKNLDLINLLLLKSLQKAKYSVSNLGHFGLNLEHYLHFTSPIRRYPDTMVHKLLWEHMFQGLEFKPEDLNRALHDIAEHSTEQEVKNSEVSRELENHKIIEFMNKRIDSYFRGTITSTARSGAWVRLDEYLIEVFVKSNGPLMMGKNVLIQPIHNSREFKLLKTL